MYKPAKDLRLNDEFTILHDRTAKRCFVASTPVVDGSIVKFKVHPCCKRWSKNKLRLIKLAVSHSIEVCDDRINQAIDLRRLYHQEILLFLKPGLPLALPSEIKAFITSRHGKVKVTLFERALRGLKITRRIIAAPFQSDQRILSYRGSLEGLTGIPIIENQGLSSQSLGWIVRWQENRQTETLQPVIRVILKNGETIERFSRDQHLNPIPRSYVAMWRQVTIAKELFENPNPQPPIQIRADLLFRLQHSLENKQYKKYDSDEDSYHYILLEVAKVLNFVPEHHRNWNGRNALARDQAVQYLDRFYSGWRSGRFAA